MCLSLFACSARARKCAHVTQFMQYNSTRTFCNQFIYYSRCEFAFCHTYFYCFTARTEYLQLIFLCMFISHLRYIHKSEYIFILYVYSHNRIACSRHSAFLKIQNVLFFSFFFLFCFGFLLLFVCACMHVNMS